MCCVFLADHYSDGGANAVRITVPCERMRDTFNVVFVRNFNLTANGNVDTFKFVTAGEKDIPRVWFPHIGKLSLFSTSSRSGNNVVTGYLI